MKGNMLKSLIITALLGLSFSVLSCAPIEGVTPVENIKVTGVSLNKSELELEIDQSETLEATISPSDASNKEVTWLSNDSEVASVKDGVVKAVSEGKATITVKTKDGEYTATCEVTVKTPIISVSGVSLNKTSLPLAVGGTYYLIANVTPSNAPDTSVIWSSSDSDVATINSDGKVTGVKAGTTIITVTTNDGNKTATCEVTVSQSSISVEGVELNADTLSLYIGKKATLSETIIPSNATNQNVSWSSSNEAVATVANGTVIAIASGSTMITVTTEDGGKTATCDVVVSENSGTEDAYVPDPNDDTIFKVTLDNLPEPNSKGEYEYTINQNYKQIYVNAIEKKIILNLEGTTIENGENSPIYVVDCDSIDISAKKGTENFIKDTRAIYTEDVDSQGKGAIYVANGDLTLKGKGSLDINGNYYNGIHGKDDVDIKNLTLSIYATNHAVKGNDSITIDSATLTIVCGGDGLHTSNSDVSSKGNQRGDITINSGTIKIDSWGDAMAAAHDLIVNDGDIDIRTNTKSSFNGEVVDTTQTTLYLKMNSSTYSSGNYTYAAYINGEWYKAEFKKSTTESSSGGWGPGWGLIDRPGPGGGWPGGGGSSTTYYIYEIEKPANASSFKLYRFAGSNVSQFSTSTYNAVSDSKTFNTSYNQITITVSGGTISLGSWSNYDGMSSKGLKAENIISIVGGTINLDTLDDSIHANNDGILENGETPLGNVVISGGEITLKTADDGVHADGTLEISGGKLIITTSYEGLEGNVINISGGEMYVYATDDGVNAGSGKVSSSINISGGYLDVEVPTSGDTDGIDSNGTYTQTGGVVIIKGPGSASGNNFGAAALDTDSTVTLSNCTLIIFGGSEQTPRTTGVTKSLSSGTKSVGQHTVSFNSGAIIYTTTLKTSSNGCVVYSALGSATIN